ncbi:hypothetical protein QWY84_14740 [Aquisalimonas lutea]|uniref:hypothetical protein n=1 Tax=Aquisalimonas lutea TaxID=1327750 RepID=UPI0025B45C4F|nr:hypothetical protein [Aquisalimonas lutea]MDN3518874.1 hypothetical protein [Aquisalimonas lutea]
MAVRFYALTRFIAPDFRLLVPDWTFGAVTDDFVSGTFAYQGPVYILLTPRDVAVLVNVSPEGAPDAVDIIARTPHQGRINHAPATTRVREATLAEARSCLARLATDRGGTMDELRPIASVWVARDLAFSILDEPHRVAFFRLDGTRCRDCVALGDEHRIDPIPEA